MAKKRNKKISLKEFRAWLEGVEELQPKDWSPSSEQWKLIRDKIKYINDAETELLSQPVREVMPTVPMRSGLAPELHMDPTLPVPPPPIGGIPSGDVVMSPEAKRLLQNSGQMSPTKTPDIDSSNGYESTFK